MKVVVLPGFLLILMVSMMWMTSLMKSSLEGLGRDIKLGRSDMDAATHQFEDCNRNFQMERNVKKISHLDEEIKIMDEKIRSFPEKITKLAFHMTYMKENVEKSTEENRLLKKHLNQLINRLEEDQKDAAAAF